MFYAFMLLFLHIICLFNINLLSFFLCKNVKPMRMGNLYLIFCHILHIKCMELCLWGLNNNHVKILPWCHLFHSIFFFFSFFLFKAGVSLIALGQNMAPQFFFLFVLVNKVIVSELHLFVYVLSIATFLLQWHNWIIVTKTM